MALFSKLNNNQHNNQAQVLASWYHIKISFEIVPSIIYWSALITFQMILPFSLTCDNCAGPLAWFHCISNEQTHIMGCLRLIFSLPVVALCDRFTPRSLVQALHFVLKCLCYCVINTVLTKHWGSVTIMWFLIHWCGLFFPQKTTAKYK